MAFHKTSLMCAAEISIGDLLKRSQYGQDVELDLHDGKAELRGRIKTRLSLASNGSLIASNAQQLALELVRNANTAAGGYIDGVFSISLQTPPAVIDQPIQDVLDKLNLFMRIAGEAAKVHPYAKLAWDVLSAAHAIIMAQLAIDQSIVDLANTMQDVYSFVDALEAVPSKIQQLEDVIHRIFVQTVECAVFIREYSGHGFAGRILRETMGASTPAKIAGMAQNLVALRAQFDTGVAVQTAIFCFRIQKDVTALLKNQTLMQLGSCGVPLSSRTGCLAGTRGDAIREIQNWAIQPSTGDHSSILWVYSMAGTGKSAVAASVATHFSEVERLGAFLCFDESCPGKSHPSTVVKALAHQLALYDSRLGALIIQAVNDDTRILADSLPKQFDRLIVKPLESLPVIHGEGPITIVLDGLDQCGRPNERASLLEILAHQTKALPSNIRFIITSRAVGDIREAFTMPAARIKSLELGLACGNDITVYFKSRMQEIRRKKHLPKDWPDLATLTELTVRASGFFLWAVTVSTFIDAAYNPPNRLKLLLNKEVDSMLEPDTALDKVYQAALASAGDWSEEDFVSDFRIIMGTIITSPIRMSTIAIDRLLGNRLSRPSTVTIHLLNSLLTQRPALRPIHPSFLDFLTSRERCGRDIWCFEPGPVRINSPPALLYIQRMNTELKRNICNVSFSAPLGAKLLQDDLAYACQHWVEQVCSHVEHQIWIIKELESFLRIHLLHWFEAMSIVNKVEAILPMLERVAAWLENNSPEDRSLTALVIDAVQFAHNFAVILMEHPLHVYYTALPLHPTTSAIYQTFHYESNWPDRGGPKHLQRMNADLKRNICNMMISSSLDVEAPPEDLACACQSWVDYIDAIDDPSWVMATLEFFLRTHLLHWFEAMSIIKRASDILPMLQRAAGWLTEHSPKERHLKILILDAIEFARNFPVDIAEHPLHVYYTALPLHPPDSILYQTFHDSRVDPSVLVLRDHLNIAYSSDGRRYAAWDEDGDIMVKETATGQELLTIENNGKFYIESVAFSYDGSRIAAGGSSGVYVWDSVAGAEAIGPPSHSSSSDWVRAVAWSTNGERLVSGSWNGEMILWDTASAEGNRLSTTRLPKSPEIVSVAFSSDGSQIAGCSHDRRVFVWDPLGGSIVWSVEIPKHREPRVRFSSNDMGEFLLVKWNGGAQACDLSTGALLPPPDSLAGAVGLSRGGFIVDLLYQRIRKDVRWEDDRYLEWGAHGEYFAFRTLIIHQWQHHVVLLPKGVI
ncbi:hypothetical protein HWV62_223 [Athelia sp. TMB]|nr:hypothetical protein HWV62_223 [Athelia sp. TMB]